MALDDKKLLSTRGEEILRARHERVKYKSKEESELYNRTSRQSEEINLVRSNPNAGAEQLRFAEATRLQMEEDKRRSDALRNQRVQEANMTFSQDLRKVVATPTTNRDIADSRRMAEQFNPLQVSAQARTQSTFQLMKQIQEGKSGIASHNEALLQMNPADPSGLRRIEESMGQRDSLIRGVGASTAAFEKQRRLGIDIESRHQRASGIVDSNIERLDSQKLRSDVKAGEFGSKKQIDEQLNAVTQKLIETFSKFDTALKAGTEDADKLAKEFEDTAKEQDKLQRISSEMTRQGAGQGMMGQFARLGGVMGNVISGGADLYRHGMITTEQQDMQNRTGVAKMTDQRFWNVEGTSRGDAASWRRMMSDSYGRGAGRAKMMSDRSEIAETGEIIGGMVQTGGRFAGAAVDAVKDNPMQSMFEGATTGGAATTGRALLEGANAALPSALNTGKRAISLGKSITPTQDALTEFQNLQENEDAMNAVRDYRNQQAFDYIKDLTTATRGLGGGGSTRTRAAADFNGKVANVAQQYSYSDPTKLQSPMDRVRGAGFGGDKGIFGNIEAGFSTAKNISQDFLDQAFSSESGNRPHPGIFAERSGGTATMGGGNRENLFDILSDERKVKELAKEAGLGKEEIANLAGMGTGLIGRSFGQTGGEDIKKAGQYAAAGYVQSPEQIIQSLGKLSQSGGADMKNLEDIMKIAVANGMDSSKNIMQMVDATSQIASRSAAMGVSTTEASIAGLAGGTKALRQMGVSEQMAGQVAGVGMMTADAFSSRNETGMSQVLEYQKLREQFPTVSGMQLEALKRLTSTQIGTLVRAQKKGDKKKLQQTANQLGVGDVEGLLDKGALERLGKTEFESVFDFSVPIGTMDPAERDALKEKIYKGEKLNDKEESQAQRAGLLWGGSGVSIVAGSAAAIKGELEEGTQNQGLNTKATGTLGKTQGMLQAPAEMGAEMYTGALGDAGTKQGKTSKEAIEGLASTFEGLAQSLPAQYETAAVKASESLKIPVNQFSTSVYDLKTVVDQMTEMVKSVISDTLGSGKSGPTSVHQSPLKTQSDKSLKRPGLGQ